MGRLAWLAWLCALPCSLVVGAARGQEAPNPSFYLVNRSAVAIIRVFASPAERPNWGPNRIRVPLAPGANVAIRLPVGTSCGYDVRVVYATGRSEDRRGLDTCSIDNISFPGGHAVSTPSASAQVDDPSFVLINGSRSTLNELYLSPADDMSWGAERLGTAGLRSGAATTVRLPPGSCLYDLRVVFADGEASDRRRLNLCEIVDLRVP